MPNSPRSPPSGWRRVRFGDVVRNVNENVRNPLDSELERFVGLDHIDPESLHIRRWGLIEEGITFTRKFAKGQVLFGKRRAYQRKVAVAEFDGICSGDILVFEPANADLLPELLPFIVQSDGFFEHALGTSAGSLSPRTKWKDLARYEFALPPKDEQRRIAEILWAADEAIEKQGQSIEASRSLKASLIGRVFQAGQTDTDLPDGWQLAALNDLAEINPKMLKNISDDLAVSFVTMADVSEEGGISNQSEKQVREVKKGFTYFADDDVLFAKITPCMENGKGALVRGLTNGMGFGSTEFFVVRPKEKSDAQFIYYLTMAHPFRQQAKRMMRGSAGQQRVPREFLEKYVMAVPSLLERTRLGNLLQGCDRNIEAQKLNLENLKTLKKNLLAKLFHP